MKAPRAKLFNREGESLARLRARVFIFEFWLAPFAFRMKTCLGVLVALLVFDEFSINNNFYRSSS
jgi:hypothetical protein